MQDAKFFNTFLMSPYDLQCFRCGVHKTGAECIQTQR